MKKEKCLRRMILEGIVLFGMMIISIIFLLVGIVMALVFKNNNQIFVEIGISIALVTFPYVMYLAYKY